MAYTFRASSNQGNASGAGLTVSKPAGTVDGDLIVVVGYLESDTNTWSSVGSGFTSVRTQANTGIFTVQVWYKWASGEGASWTWTPTTSNWRTVVVASYSGGSGSGDARDVSGGSQGDGVGVGSQTAPSVTTTAANDLLVFAYGNFGGADPTSTSGAATNLRVKLGGVAIADANIATASATGTTAPNGTGTQDYAAEHCAFFLSPAGATKAMPPFRRPYRFFPGVR